MENNRSFSDAIVCCCKIINTGFLISRFTKISMNIICSLMKWCLWGQCGFEELFENRAKNKEVLCTDKEPSSENNDMSTVNIEVEQIKLYRLNLFSIIL